MTSRTPLVLILAAGDGGRLAPLTNDQPKALLSVAGQPLIDYTISTLAAQGVEDFMVVVGHQGERIQEHIKARWPGLHVRYVWNRDLTTENAYSLRLGTQVLGEDAFLLCMGDHLFSPGILGHALEAGHALAASPHRHAVFVDQTFSSDPEATRVSIGDDGAVTAIGKGLPAWDGIDIGLFYLHTEIRTHLETLSPQTDLNGAWQPLLREHGLQAIPITEGWWTDIDTPDDLRNAETLIMKNRANGV